MVNLAPNPEQQVIAPVAGVPLEEIGFMLDNIGFNNPAQRILLMEAGLAEYEDFRHLIDKDIRDMADVAQVLFSTDDTSELTSHTNSQAGNAFGGKPSAAKKAKGPGE
jgi:hypothetical protein